jgi:hypothetical protein
MELMFLKDSIVSGGETLRYIISLSFKLIRKDVFCFSAKFIRKDKYCLTWEYDSLGKYGIVRNKF